MSSPRQKNLFDPTSSAEDSPARTYPWLDAVLDWLESVADSSGGSSRSSPSAAPAGFLSKTSLAFCRLAKGETWELFSGRWLNWGMGPPTEFSTLSGSEFPSDAVVCSLSDVLETGDVPQKYYLSPKACRGILRRAEKRGRALPTALREALAAVAEDSILTERTTS